MAHIMMPATTIAGVILSLAMCHSVARSGSTHGTPAVFITASWTTPGLQAWWVSRGLRARPSYPTRILRVSSSENTSTWVTNGRSIPSVAGKSGFNCARSSGTDESGPWTLLIAPRGMPSSRVDIG